VLAYLSRYNAPRSPSRTGRLIASRPAQRHVQRSRITGSKAPPIYDDDARCRRIHSPVSHPRAAQRLPSHSAITACLLARTAPKRSRKRASSWVWPRLRPKRRSKSIRRRPSARPALPLLWRPHVRHRDLRGRLPTTLTIQPRLSSQSGSTPHEHGCHITHPHRQTRFSAGHNPATATLDRTATRQRFPQRNRPRKPSSSVQTRAETHQRRHLLNRHALAPRVHRQHRDQIVHSARLSVRTSISARSFNGGFRNDGPRASRIVAMGRHPNPSHVRTSGWSELGPLILQQRARGECISSSVSCWPEMRRDSVTRSIEARSTAKPAGRSSRAISNGCTFAPPAIWGLDGSELLSEFSLWTSARCNNKRLLKAR